MQYSRFSGQSLESGQDSRDIMDGAVNLPNTEELRKMAVDEQPNSPGPKPRYHLKAWVRRSFALFLVFFSIFHAQPAMLATSYQQTSSAVWLFSLCWILLVLSLGSAGLGLLGVRNLGRFWRQLALIGAFSSVVLTIGATEPARTTLIVLDVLVFVAALVSKPYDPPIRTRNWFVRALSASVKGVVVASMVYGSTVIAFRPWFTNWGARPQEISKSLPGDETSPFRHNFINHVISVDAPPEKVWAWLIQLGQDKAGFYSYDWLERAVGDDIHNRFELRPEWQQLRKGDVVRATQPGYLWGWIGAYPGWEVLTLEPNRTLQLDQWGTFWLDPLPDGGTRLGVRSHIGDVPFLAAPIEVFLFEPIHFVMEQRMLRTLKELSEQRS
jgi:hypothetical protein